MNVNFELFFHFLKMQNTFLDSSQTIFRKFHLFSNKLCIHHWNKFRYELLVRFLFFSDIALGWWRKLYRIHDLTLEALKDQIRFDCPDTMRGEEREILVDFILFAVRNFRSETYDRKNTSLIPYSGIKDWR